MEFKELVPILAVALGWFLNSFATAMTTRAGTRQNLGILLAKLVTIHQSVATLIGTAETFKDSAGSWKEYEDVRSYVYSKHFFWREAGVADAHSAIDKIAGIAPIQSIGLHSIVDSLEKSKQVSFRHTVAASPKAYVSLLSAHEVALEFVARELRQAILRLALRHSVLTLVRTFLMLRRRDRNSRNADFVRKLVLDASSEALGAASEVPGAKTSGESQAEGDTKSAGP